ncbi:Dihydroanticapsin 7-dehydrogenase, partial [Geodia barretti]
AREQSGACNGWSIWNRASNGALVRAGRRKGGCVRSKCDWGGRYRSTNPVGRGCSSTVAGDVSDSSDAKRMVEATIESYGRIDVALNSAGIISDFAVPSDATFDVRRVLEINLRGTYLICWLAIQQMRESGGGSIVNISSINGVVGAPIGLGSGFDPYVPSKGGVVQLTKNLAIQFGRDNIRVNCICPGHVNTSLIRSITTNPQIRERLEERYPLGRFAEPEEVAYAALFLASNESSFVTGAPLLVDGGYTAL